MSTKPTCLLNDLYVLPDYRGKGVGRAIVRYCGDYAKAHGYGKLWWLTEQNNHAAQTVYDGLGAQRSTWYQYELTL